MTGQPAAARRAGRSALPPHVRHTCATLPFCTNAPATESLASSSQKTLVRVRPTDDEGVGFAMHLATSARTAARKSPHTCEGVSPVRRMRSASRGSCFQQSSGSSSAPKCTYGSMKALLTASQTTVATSVTLKGSAGLSGMRSALARSAPAPWSPRSSHRDEVLGKTRVHASACPGMSNSGMTRMPRTYPYSTSCRTVSRSYTWSTSHAEDDASCGNLSRSKGNDWASVRCQCSTLYLRAARPSMTRRMMRGG
mmetsp:Transcript_7658/g.24550  ORF Transcript_7658/g.24550 Transcript_7658/m.24550 type:complete len:253 (-) Transcript_7658:1052-1810(-)